MFTRTVARKSTGGKAPRKQLASKGARKGVGGKGVFIGNDGGDEGRRYQVNINEYKEILEKSGNISRLIMDNDHDNNNKSIIEYVNNQYKNCDDLVKHWIYLDLKEYHKQQQHKSPPHHHDHGNEELDESLLKKLDDNSKYEIFQFIPTFSPLLKATTESNTTNTTIIEGSTSILEYQLDSNLITFHKMRLINKHFNKMMMKNILTLKHLRLVAGTKVLSYFMKLSQAQTHYDKNLKRNRNYDLDSVFLFDNLPVAEVQQQQQPVFDHQFLDFGHFDNTTTTTENTETSNSVEAILPDQNVVDPFSDNFSEDALIQQLFSKKSKKNENHPIVVDTAYMQEEMHLYSNPEHTTATGFYNYSDYNNGLYNDTTESLSLIVEDSFAMPTIVQNCSKLKSVNLLFLETPSSGIAYMPTLDGFISSSVEEVHISGAGLFHQLQYNPYYLASLCSNNCPKLKSVTLLPLIPPPYAQDDILQVCFSQLVHTNPVIDKLNIYERFGGSSKNNHQSTTLIKSETFGTTNTEPRELDFYCERSLLEIEVLEELYEKFGDYAVGSVMSRMILGYNSFSSLEQSPPDWTLFHTRQLKQFKETADYFFKRKLPVCPLLLTLLNSESVSGTTAMNITDIKLQYIMYLCNQYHNSELLSQRIMESINANPNHHFIPLLIRCGWNFTKHTNSVLEYFSRNGIHRGVSAMLSNFVFEDKFISALLKFLGRFGGSHIIGVTHHKQVITELVMYLYKKNSNFLFSTLIQPIHFKSPHPFTVPLISLLFSKMESYLVCKMIDSMDMETFNSIGQNERGDTLLHILLYLQQDFDYQIFYSILKKNPNMINMVNHKLQTPLHYLMLSPEKRKSSLVLQEITQLLNESSISLDVNVRDFMEQTPMTILKSEEFACSDIIDDFNMMIN